MLIGLPKGHDERMNKWKGNGARGNILGNVLEERGAYWGLERGYQRLLSATLRPTVGGRALGAIRGFPQSWTLEAEVQLEALDLGGQLIKSSSEVGCSTMRRRLGTRLRVRLRCDAVMSENRRCTPSRRSEVKACG